MSACSLLPSSAEVHRHVTNLCCIISRHLSNRKDVCCFSLVFLVDLFCSKIPLLTKFDFTFITVLYDSMSFPCISDSAFNSMDNSGLILPAKYNISEICNQMQKLSASHSCKNNRFLNPQRPHEQYPISYSLYILPYLSLLV